MDEYLIMITKYNTSLKGHIKLTSEFFANVKQESFTPGAGTFTMIGSNLKLYKNVHTCQQFYYSRAVELYYC